MRRLALVSLVAVVSLGLAACFTRAAGGPTDRPHSSPPSQLVLSFVGDIMAHPPNYLKKPYAAIYQGVEPYLRSSDLAFGNLELTVDPDQPEAGWPRFSVDPDYVQAAIDAGFTVFSDANNHIGDYGVPGILSTLRIMSGFAHDDHIYFSGIRATADEPMTPVTIDKGGWKIGFLAITEFLNETHGKELVNLVDYRDPKIRQQFIDYLRTVTRSYDAFILSVHGGIEYDLAPERAKENFFQEALDAGVTIVWSQHPHVLEPWGTVRIDGTRRLIIYSSGNFISGQTYNIDPARPWEPRAYTGDAALFRVRIERTPQGAAVASVDPVLISNYKNDDGEMVVQPLANLAAAGLPDPWGAYYAYRYRAMRDLAPDVFYSDVERDFTLPEEPPKRAEEPPPKAGG